MYLFTIHTSSKPDNKQEHSDDIDIYEFALDGEKYENAEDAASAIDTAIKHIENAFDKTVRLVMWRKVSDVDGHFPYVFLSHEYNERDFIADFNGEF